MGFRNRVTSLVDTAARDAAAAAQQAAAAAQAAATQAINLASDPLAQIPDGAVPGSKLAADAIDGRTITGATLRTAASGQRVQIDSTNGLVGYNAAGAPVTQVSPADGSLVATNATLTGTFRTGAPGSRHVELRNDASGGVIQFLAGDATDDQPPTIATTSQPGGPAYSSLTIAGGADAIGKGLGSIRFDFPDSTHTNGSRITLAPNYSNSGPGTVLADANLTVTGKVNGQTLTDGGWKALTLAAGWTATVAQYRVLNGVFYATVYATSAAAWASGATLFTCPPGTAPTWRQDFTSMWSTTPNYVIAAATGAVTMGQAGAAGAGVLVTLSWPI